MINKFQQGGAAPQLGGSILALIQQLPKDLQQLLMLAFALWAQLKGVDIQQLQLDPNMLEQALGLFMQEMQAQSAKNGAKLNYIKRLKHQCAEDEHLEYFAKGGRVGCNCVKNAQESQKNALATYKEKCGGKMKKKQIGGSMPEEKCGGKMKKHLIGGTLELLRKSLGL